jgi:hypothetical protein
VKKNSKMALKKETILPLTGPALGGSEPESNLPGFDVVTTNTGACFTCLEVGSSTVPIVYTRP